MYYYVFFVQQSRCLEKNEIPWIINALYVHDVSQV